MEQDLEKKINEITEKFECPKGFSCYTEGFENLCKAKDIGLHSILECLDKDGPLCLFSINVRDTYYCECPLRVYIARNLKK
jgi:hypothetical protein